MAENEEDPVHRSTAAPIFISSVGIRSMMTHTSLIRHLQTTLPSFTSAIRSPLRHTHQTGESSYLILMPSWSTSPLFPYIGTKIVTHNSGNSAFNFPGVQAIYVLFNSVTGQPLASIDATELTLVRTACISALASSYLSRKESQILVMIGAGSLAPHLIHAHLAVRQGIVKVIVWNRTPEKAEELVHKMEKEACFNGVSFESNRNLEEIVRLGDIITCATNSKVALVKGVNLKKGVHLDLVGSFTPAMRECDDEALRRGRVFVDNDAAAVEAGELVGAIERGVMKRDEIAGNLVEVITEEKDGRMNSDEITVFKSVGSAAVDLLTAQVVYERFERYKDSLGLCFNHHTSKI